MSLMRCSRCGKKPNGRLASIYWAVFEGDGSRSAHKTRWCRDCFEEAAELVLDAARVNDAGLTEVKCPGCSLSIPNAGCEIYSTIFAPNRDPERLSLELCAACYPHILGLTKKGSTPLLERSTFQPTPPADGW
jgi:hypothetical protein